MATFTNAELVAQLYIGFYDRAPDPVGLNYWIGRLEAGVSIQDIGDSFAASPEASETYPYFKFPSILSLNDFLAQVYENVFGREIDEDGLNYYRARIEGGESAGSVVASILGNAATNDGSPDQAYLQNKVDAGLHWATVAATSDINIYQENGRLTAAADASAHSIIDGITADPASVDEANAATDSFFAGEGSGDSFTMTPGVDHIVGTAGDDTIIAGTSNTGLLNGNDFGTTDTVDGGAGNDTLTIIDSTVAGTNIIPLKLVNVETVEIQSNPAFGAGTTHVNFGNASGIENLNVINSFGGVDAFNLQEAASIGLTNTYDAMGGGAPQLTRVGFADTADLGDTQAINVDGANTVLTIDAATIGTVTTLDVDSSNHASHLALDVDGAAFATLNITGDAALELEGVADELDHLTAVNAETFTGALDLDLNNNDEDVTFNGGSGDTDLLIGGGDNTITTGAGDDDIAIRSGTAGQNTISTGDGDDIVRFRGTFGATDKYDGGAGYDTIQMNSNQAGLLNGNANVTNVEHLVLGNQLTATNDLILNGYNLPTGLNDLTINGNLTNNGADVTISNMSRGTITLANSQSNGDFTLAGDSSQTYSVVIDREANGNLTVDSAHVGGMGTLNIGFAADTKGDLALSTLTFDSDVKSISISGSADNDVTITATGGAGELTGTLDLSGFNGKFDMGAAAVINSDLTTINVGNLGAGSVISIVSGTAVGDANTFVFGSDLDNGISIGNAAGKFDLHSAAGVNGDVLDLAALGVTSIAQLHIAYGVTDTVITSATGAFEGSITLVGINAGVTADDFHFA